MPCRGRSCARPSTSSRRATTGTSPPGSARHVSSGGSARTAASTGAPNSTRSPPSSGASSPVARGTGRSSMHCSGRRGRRSGPEPGSSSSGSRRREPGSIAARICSASQPSGWGRCTSPRTRGSSACCAGTWRPSGPARSPMRRRGRASTGRRSFRSRSGSGCGSSTTRTAGTSSTFRARRYGARILRRRHGSSAPGTRRSSFTSAVRRSSPSAFARACSRQDAAVVRDVPRRRLGRGDWKVERVNSKATLRLEPFEPLPRAALADVRDEGERLVRFHEPDAVSFAVRVRR